MFAWTARRLEQNTIDQSAGSGSWVGALGLSPGPAGFWADSEAGQWVAQWRGVLCGLDCSLHRQKGCVFRRICNEIFEFPSPGIKVYFRSYLFVCGYLL